MNTRTTSRTVTFQRPFILSGFEQLQAAGAYAVDTEEELIEALSFPVWKRISTVMRLRDLGATEHVNIAPHELDEALIRDGSKEPLPKSQPPNLTALRDPDPQ